VPVYAADFAGTHRAYPQKNGQTELLIWVAGYIPRWFTRPLSGPNVDYPNFVDAINDVTNFPKPPSIRILFPVVEL